MQLGRIIERSRQRFPGKIATLCGDRVHTWTELENRIASLASALKRLSLGAGDRVAILALNSDRYLEVLFAVPWADGVVVPMNVRWSVAENLYCVEDCTPHILLVDDNFLDHARQIGAASSELQAIVYMGNAATPEGMISYEKMLSEATPAPLGSRGHNDLAGIFYTGGTTGFPKGVMLSHGNLLQSAMNALIDMQEMSSEEIYLHAAPMFHLADGSQTIATALQGIGQRFIASFEPAVAAAAIAEHRVTQTILVPTMLQMIFDHPQFASFDLSSLRRVVYGASPMPQALLEKMMAALPELQLIQGYGQTEMAPSITRLGPDDHQLEGPISHRRASVGQPVMGVDVKIVDEHLKPVAQGGIGQIAARGNNAMLGYWNKPELTAQTVVDGWVLTGDVGYFDEDGYLYLVDRVKDMIVSGGENVFSVEVENALTSHPDVQVAAVIGIPSEQWGEAVHGIVITVPDSTPSAAELIRHCKGRIAGYKCPKTIAFRTEDLPLSGAGKVLKTELRKPFWEGHTEWGADVKLS